MESPAMPGFAVWKSADQIEPETEIIPLPLRPLSSMALSTSST
jgi:hypothetical protein